MIDESDYPGFDDPADADGSIVGDEDGIGGAILNLSNALIVSEIGIASVFREDDDSGPQPYGLMLSGHLAFQPDAARRMMTVLGPNGAAELVFSLVRAAVKENDRAFLIALLELVGEEL